MKLEEIKLESEASGEESKKLLQQTEELVELAHRTQYHQLEGYNQMLVLLAKMASAQKDTTCLENIAEEVTKAIEYSPSTPINQHVYLMWLLVENDRLEKMEYLLERLEARINSETRSRIQPTSRQ